MARICTPVWLTLAATIFVAAHVSALETLPGEPPVEEKHQAIQEKVMEVLSLETPAGG